MVYEGHVKNGVVVFDVAAPPEGTAVRVEPVAVSGVVSPAATDTPTRADVEALWEGLMQLAGTAQGLPPDLARRHDHYRRERRNR